MASVIGSNSFQVFELAVPLFWDLGQLVPVFWNQGPKMKACSKP
jgi:hypothetical protein